MGDDTFSVFLSSTVYGSTVSFLNATPIAYSTSTQAITTYANYYQNDYPTAESSFYTLEAGKQYYMEVYHVNSAGAGKFSLSV